MESKCGPMVISVPVVNRPGSPLSPSVDELEYHMDNNPLYVIVKSMVGLSTEKPHEYETVAIDSTV